MNRRLKTLVISTELFFSLFQKGIHPERSYEVIGDVVPDDAQLINVQHVWPNQIGILISSASFDEVKDGDQIPYLTPKWKRIYGLLQDISHCSNTDQECAWADRSRELLGMKVL